jgi:hypothetical protein
MRSITLASIAALAIALSTSAMAADYGNDSASAYLSYCRPVAAAKVLGNDQIEFPLNAQTEKCWGAFTAIQQMIPIIEAGADTPLLRVCAPESGMTTQLVAVFVKYASDHPELRHLSFGQVALQSLWKAFPCAADPLGKASEGRR